MTIGVTDLIVAGGGNGEACGDDGGAPEVWVRAAARVPGENVNWLWKNVLATGKITVIAGAAGVGKSLMVAADLAARLSVGSAWPDGAAQSAQDVLIASGQDGSEDTLVPRLVYHGADLQRVHFLEGWNGALADEPTLRDWTEPPALRGGFVPALARALSERPSVNLVVIDPVSAFLDVGAKGGPARAVLSAMQALAREYDAAIVLVTHLRTVSARGTLGVVGSDGLVSAARMVWVLTRDPHDRQRRLFMPAKGQAHRTVEYICGGEYHVSERLDVLRELDRCQLALIAPAAKLLAEFAKHLPKQNRGLGGRIQSTQ